MDCVSSGNETKVKIYKRDTKGTCIVNNIKIKVDKGFVEVYTGDKPPIIYKQVSDMTIYIDHKTKAVSQKCNGIMTYNIRDMKPKNMTFKKAMNFIINWLK